MAVLILQIMSFYNENRTELFERFKNKKMAFNFKESIEQWFLFCTFSENSTAPDAHFEFLDILMSFS